MNRGFRRLLRILTRAALLGSFLLVGATLTAPPAGAAAPVVGDCKTAPTPQVPGRGISGWFGRPNVIPPTEDPFASGARTTVYEQYDLAGMTWQTYDLGCFGNTTDVGANLDTNFGNLFLIPAKILLAATNSVLDTAFHPTFMAVFDPLIDDVSGALNTGVLKILLPLVLLGVGLLITYRAGRQQTSVVVAAVGWALIVLTAAAVLVRFPTQAGHAADRAIVSTASYIDGAVNGQDTTKTDGASSGRAAQILYQSVLYRQWLAGQFGRADSPVAKRFGPELLNATAMTWDEARIMEADPEQGRKIIESKQAKFKEVADTIKTLDPDAYANLQGKSSSRTALGLLTLIAALLTVPFLFAAGIVMIAAYMVIRLSVMLFPALATLGVARPLSHIVTGVRDAVAAALINSVLFSAGAAVAIKVLGFVLLGSGLPSWLALLLTAILSVIFWRMLRPMRSVTRLATGRNLVGEGFGHLPPGVEQARRKYLKFARHTAATYLGARAANRHDRHRHGGDDAAPIDEEQNTDPIYTDSTRGDADDHSGRRGLGNPQPVPPGGGVGGRFEAAPPPSTEHTRGPRVWTTRPAGRLPTADVRGDHAAGKDSFVEGPAAEPVDPPLWLPRPAPAVRDDASGGTVFMIYNPETNTTQFERDQGPPPAAPPAKPTDRGAQRTAGDVYDVTGVTATRNAFGTYTDGARAYGEEDLARRMEAARDDPNILYLNVQRVEPGPGLPCPECGAAESVTQRDRFTACTDCGATLRAETDREVAP